MPQWNSELLAVLVELLEEGDQVVDLLLALDAGEDHLGARDLGPGVLDVVGEGSFVPGQAGVLVGGGIAVGLDRARMPADQAVELGADEVARALADLVAGAALIEGSFTGRGVLRGG